MRLLDSLIMRAFKTLKSVKKSDVVNAVKKSSIELGISASKVVILARIESVLEFIKISRVSVDNKELAQSCVKMVSGSDSKSREVSEMDKFEEERQQNTVTVISQQYCRDLSELSDRPYLMITSVVLNTEDFSTALSYLLTEEVCTLFVETSGLKKGGSSRLKKLLEEFPKFFDNRVRVVLLFKSPSLAVLDTFSKHVEHQFGTASLVRDIASDSPERRKKLKFDSNRDDKESEKLKHEEAKVWKERCTKLEKELKYQENKVESVLEKMKDMNNENNELIIKGEKLESTLKEIQTELSVSEASRDELSTEVQTVRDTNYDLEIENERVKAESEKKDGELKELKRIMNVKNAELAMAGKANAESDKKILMLEKTLEEKKKELGVLVIESEGAKGVPESERSKNDSKSFKKVIEDIRNIAESKKISLKEALYRKVKNLKLKIIHTEEKEGSFNCEIEHESGLERFNLQSIKVSGSGKSKKLSLNAAIESLLIQMENIVE